MSNCTSLKQQLRYYHRRYISHTPNLLDTWEQTSLVLEHQASMFELPFTKFDVFNVCWTVFSLYVMGKRNLDKTVEWKKLKVFWLHTLKEVKINFIIKKILKIHHLFIFTVSMVTSVLSQGLTAVTCAFKHYSIPVCSCMYKTIWVTAVGKYWLCEWSLRNTQRGKECVENVK